MDRRQPGAAQERSPTTSRRIDGQARPEGGPDRRPNRGRPCARRKATGGLALLFEGGWVYGGWARQDEAPPSRTSAMSCFRPRRAGRRSRWAGRARAGNELAQREQARWPGSSSRPGTQDTVAKLNTEDPHPVARKDAADVPEFKADHFLVDSTEPSKRPSSSPLDPGWGKVIDAIQKSTASVAAGEMAPPTHRSSTRPTCPSARRRQGHHPVVVASTAVAANARRRSLGRNRLYLAGLTPAAFLLALFFVGPALWALASSFTNLALVGLDAANPRFVGLDNYAACSATRTSGGSCATRSSSWSARRSSASSCSDCSWRCCSTMPSGAASWRRNLVYAAVLLAWVNPTIIAGFLWAAMFDFYYGTLNAGLQPLGLAAGTGSATRPCWRSSSPTPGEARPSRCSSFSAA